RHRTGAHAQPAAQRARHPVHPGGGCRRHPYRHRRVAEPPGRHRSLFQGGRLVVLNKIDGLWDELKSAAELLAIPPARVFAVSAQKALLAKVNGDDALLAKSRLPQLEQALSKELIPAKRDIVGTATRTEIRALAATVRSILDARSSGIQEQLAELRGLRGKNQDVVEHMMDRIKQEKDLFERGMQRYTALRTVFTQQTTAL